MILQVRKLNLEGTRKTSEPDMGGSSLIHRSIDCLALQKEASSDSDLLRSAPPWTRQRFQLSPVLIIIYVAKRYYTINSASAICFWYSVSKLFF